MFDRIKYLIMLKSNISDVYFLNNLEIKIYSIADLSFGKTLKLHNTVMLTKSVFN